MLDLFFSSDLNHTLLVFLALLFVLLYEVINGFHDTANAVSTVIYTRSISPNFAVLLSGIFNFLGVILGGLTVAYSIVHLLPYDLLVNTDVYSVLAMVFSILLAAVSWNLFTWYFGLPASSSHSLIGAIIGIGCTHAIMTASSLIDVLNISKMTSIFLSLICSPILGFIVASILVFLLRSVLRYNYKQYFRLHMTPLEREKVDGRKNPPWLIRIILIISSIGVSYAHGANDGQKGIGLMMLVLIGLMPANFLVNIYSDNTDIIHTRSAINHLEKYYFHQGVEINNTIKNNNGNKVLVKKYHFEKIIKNIHKIQLLLNNVSNYKSLSIQKRCELRYYLMRISNNIEQTMQYFHISDEDQYYLKHLKEEILKTIEYAPMWVILIVAVSLSLGTMVGWKRIVTTIGEKIGKKRMTYAQAMSAQITAAFAIGLASYTGIPVSTTHILSSSVAGTMFIDGSGIQKKTIRNIILAWIFTLPISILLSSFFYWLALLLISLYRLAPE